MDRTFLPIGAIFGFLGVGFGSFGAHALRGRLSPEMLAVFEAGVRYQMYHTFAVLIVAAAIGRVGEAQRLVPAGWVFLRGVISVSWGSCPVSRSGYGTLGIHGPRVGL